MSLSSSFEFEYTLPILLHNFQNVIGQEVDREIWPICGCQAGTADALPAQRHPECSYTVRYIFVLMQNTLKRLIPIYVRWWTDYLMLERILVISKKDADALNHVIRFSGMDKDLVLTKHDMFLISKFVDLFALVKKKTDSLSGEDFSSIQLVWPAVREIRNHIERFKKDATIGKFAKDFLKLFDHYFK